MRDTSQYDIAIAAGDADGRDKQKKEKNRYRNWNRT